MSYRTVPLDIQEAQSMLKLYSNGVYIESDGMAVSYHQVSGCWYVSVSVESPGGLRIAHESFPKLIDAAEWLVKQSNWMAREIEDAL